jgi:mRNA-degrading endonuclease RelE of RelBE toxin-antitoxin system
MEFRIADTFLNSLRRLTGDEQNATKTTVFDLQVDPANPGMQLHKLDRARDKNFWSVRISRDIRLIVHRSRSSLLVCYVGHHDDAYDWAERRKLEVHPRTGAAQIVEVRELVREVEVPVLVAASARAPSAPLLGHVSDEVLLGFGVPAEWLDDVRAATEDTVLELAEHLPAEAAEALLDLAVGRTPVVAAVAERSWEGTLLRAVAPTQRKWALWEVRDEVAVAAEVAAFEHPDAQRRFRAIADVEELERALNYPWDKWSVFLHPSQREIVEGDYAGPVRVMGSAGTGKTIVALHRAVHLARSNEEARVLLTSFSEPLAAALRSQLRRLVSSQPRLAERLDVHAIDAVARRLHELNLGPFEVVTREGLRALIDDARSNVQMQGFSSDFLLAEWDDTVDIWQVRSWEEYRDVPRLGRRTRLAEAQRAELWAVFEVVLERLDASGKTTMAGLYGALSRLYGEGAIRPYEFVVVDEAQDLSVPQMRFLAELAGDRPNGLFLAGDLGQRIFQLPFSWKALGLDVKDRTFTLRINYRTSQQIRSRTDRLLPRRLSDVDGIVDERGDTISLINGVEPKVSLHDDETAEIQSVASWLGSLRRNGTAPHEIGVFVRSAEQMDRAVAALIEANVPYVVLDEHLKTRGGHAALATMHLAKGLEFRAVAVMACDDEVIPLQGRIEDITDPADLEEVYNTERHLLYVACTRARDDLVVSAVRPGSEFLEDMEGPE